MNWGIESLFASYSDANTRVSGFDSQPCVQKYMYITHIYIYIYTTNIHPLVMFQWELLKGNKKSDGFSSHGIFLTPEATCLKLNRFYLYGGCYIYRKYLFNIYIYLYIQYYILYLFIYINTVYIVIFDPPAIKHGLLEHPPLVQPEFPRVQPH